MKPKPKKSTVSVPRRFQGGIAETAYRAGYDAGYGNKALQTIGFGLAIESVFDIVKNGVDGLDVPGVVQRTAEKIERHMPTVTLAERLRRMEKEKAG